MVQLLLARNRVGHWLPVLIVVAAAVVAFAMALGLSLYLPVELE